MIEQLQNDPSAHVRRIILTHLRDFSYEKKKGPLLNLALAGPLEDRTYVEAVELAADGCEDQFWSDYSSHRKISGAKDWDRATHQLVWRLHGDSMIADMVARMLMSEVSTEDRRELVASSR